MARKARTARGSCQRCLPAAVRAAPERRADGLLGLIAGDATQTEEADGGAALRRNRKGDEPMGLHTDGDEQKQDELGKRSVLSGRGTGHLQTVHRSEPDGVLYTGTYGAPSGAQGALSGERIVRLWQRYPVLGLGERSWQRCLPDGGDR